MSSDNQTTVDHVGTARPLPPAIGERARDLYALDRPPETFGELVAGVSAAIREALDRAPTVADLCHDEDGRHEAHVGDETYTLACTLDGLVLPFLREADATVRSRTPDGDAMVTFEVSVDAVTVAPASAVVSLGIRRDVEARVDPPEPADAYGAVCPYVNAFPDRDAYGAWAAETDAATTALPVPDAVAVARALTWEVKR